MFENTGIQFIDLFSGIGGFHQAMKMFQEAHDDINVEFVLASEIDKAAIETYDKNYLSEDDTSAQDVTKLVDTAVDHFILDRRLSNFNFMCAGFPCQAFSKAGKRLGFQDQIKGTLFFNLQQILQARINEGNPVQYILLENVANLVSHDKGNTWYVIRQVLEEMDYIIPDEPLLLSPHQFDVPQLRNRIFIPGIHRSVFNDDRKHLKIEVLKRDGSKINPRTHRNNSSISSVINHNDNEFNYADFFVNDIQAMAIEFWTEFMEITTDGKYDKTIGFPIWLEYFGRKVEKIELQIMPEWKRNIILRNEMLYNEKPVQYSNWLKKNKKLLKLMTPTHKKFEWQAGNYLNNMKDGILQFRPSGLRVKRPTESPALVAIVHIPIIFDEFHDKYRYLTPREVARLQNFPEDFILDERNQQAYKQFGNSVNVEVVYQIIEAMHRIL